VYPNFISFSPLDFIKYKTNRLSIVEKKEDNITFYGFPKIHFKRTLFFYSYLERIYNKIRSKGFYIDIIHAHSILFAGYEAARLAEKKNIPLIVTEHHSRFIVNGINKSDLPYVEYTVKIAKRIISVGNRLNDTFTKYFGKKDKFVVIPNFINSFNNLESADQKTDFKNSSANKKGYYFCSVGNLRKIKGYDLLLKAFYKAFKDNDEVFLRIAGSGPLKKELEQLSQELLLTQKIEFLGSLKKDQVYKLLENSDCFVSSSLFETFGVSIIEALFSGLPVIATRCGGPEDTIDETNGILVPPNDVEQLTKALLWIYQNHDAFDREQIKRNAMAKFGEKTVVAKLVDLYIHTLEL
jgi:glycosyltransferase involved in cell wall biosynthesis